MSRLLAGLAVFVLLAVAVPTAEAQTGKLTGVVTDAQSGVALEGAQLILQGTGITALTGSNGRYFLVNVPPGTYTVLVRRIGYSSAEVRNVFIQIDVTRTVDVELSPTGAIGVEEIVVSAEEVPLVQPGVTGSASNIRAEEIQALPVTNIQGVLALQQGFIAVPQNTDIISFNESRRNPITPVRIRGGRAGETITLIDNIPVNNFVFGGPAFDITTEAIEQFDFQRGGFEPQYGNALSGIINIATREGGSQLAGAVSYQTSAIGGALGNTSDELLDYDQFQGYLSGPVPATGNALRFLLAGRLSNSADRVLEFDDQVTSGSGANTCPSPAGCNTLDLYPGWRAFGYEDVRDVTAKLTYYLTPTAKLSVEGIRYERERLPFDFDYVLTGFDPLNAPAVLNREDSLNAAGGAIERIPTVGQGGDFSFRDLVQGSISVNRTLLTAKWDHTLGRWAYKASGGVFDQSRQTCNFYQGVCLGDRFADQNFQGQFVAPIKQTTHPTTGTDFIFGGEDLRSIVGRFDIQGQATDHHAVQFGGFYQHHDLDYEEFFNTGASNVVVIPTFYRAKPWEAAAYFQDKIEYDFITIKLGARFDFGRAGGLFFANPRDPTNGTSAREVCEGSYPGIPAFVDGSNTGFDACTLNRSLLDSATALAQGDDFVESSTRTQFSPRIGVSFPLSERSQVFFNFGRYSQNPLYNNVFTNTGIGTVAGSVDEDGDGVCDPDAVVPGTTQCHPIIFSEAFSTPFLGNPNLLTEKTTSYEMGFAAEVGDQYAFQVTAFSKDQYGLSGVRQGGQSAAGQKYFDVGATYGTALYDYYVIINQDFQSVRGFEVQLRRRLFDYWGFNINYAFSQATTNAAAPENQFENEADEGLPVNNKEITSEIDIPHVFNASVFFRVANESPFGVGVLDAIVRNTNLTVTFTARSGLPYTPTLSFTGFGDAQLEQNSGRMPGYWNVDLLAQKDFVLTNLRWGVFARISNLLDAKSCIQVYPSSGLCDGGTIDQNTSRTGNSANSFTSTFLDRPQYYSDRRQISFGARMSF
jgi:hypothetical protein